MSIFNQPDEKKSRGPSKNHKSPWRHQSISREFRNYLSEGERREAQQRRRENGR